MSKKVWVRTFYRGSNAYGGSLEVKRIAVRKAKYSDKVDARIDWKEWQGDEFLAVELSGDAGFLGKARVVMPKSVALSWGAILLSAAGEAAGGAEVDL